MTSPGTAKLRAWMTIRVRGTPCKIGWSLQRFRPVQAFSGRRRVLDCAFRGPPRGDRRRRDGVNRKRGWRQRPRAIGLGGFQRRRAVRDNIGRLIGGLRIARHCGSVGRLTQLAQGSSGCLFGHFDRGGRIMEGRGRHRRLRPRDMHAADCDHGDGCERNAAAEEFQQ